MRRQNILKILTEHSSEIESRFGVASLSLFGSVARKKNSFVNRFFRRRFMPSKRYATPSQT
ncbi:MAG: hypothetical protein LWX54_06675 [Deltaproteobacteria bacterium]|jgi:hypothetical protein|nr:hypothetical protein [Deltaproteobacteria bacterium]